MVMKKKEYNSLKDAAYLLATHIHPGATAPKPTKSWRRSVSYFATADEKDKPWVLGPVSVAEGPSG